MIFVKKSSGFTLFELLVVTAIIAILVMITLPAISAVLPSFQLRNAANITGSIMRQARLQAYNFQKPTRVVLDCRQNNNSCSASLYSAIYDDDGALTGWVELNESRRMLGTTVRTTVNPAGTPVTDNPSDLYWVVFLPTGKMISSHDPMQLQLSSSNKVCTSSWNIFISRESGRIHLEKVNS